jgi:hypothetical protein
MKARYLKNLNLYMRPVLDGILIVGKDYNPQYGAFAEAQAWCQAHWEGQ